MRLLSDHVGTLLALSLAFNIISTSTAYIVIQLIFIRFILLLSSHYHLSKPFSGFPGLLFSTEGKIKQ